MSSPDDRLMCNFRTSRRALDYLTHAAKALGTDRSDLIRRMLSYAKHHMPELKEIK